MTLEINFKIQYFQINLIYLGEYNLVFSKTDPNMFPGKNDFSENKHCLQKKNDSNDLV